MKRIVEVTQSVAVEVPDTLFSPEFMAEFRRYFYDFETPEQHLEHLAQLHARGLAHDDSFIEGYGDAKTVGIKFEEIDQRMEVTT
jgi:hypothetical protein